jgi:hypothetical protein
MARRDAPDVQRSYGLTSCSEGTGGLKISAALVVFVLSSVVPLSAQMSTFGLGHSAN